MRLSMRVNGGTPVVAAMTASGYLSAHLNMNDRPKNESQRRVRIEGIKTGETESIYLKWPSVDLNVGDVVELQLLPEGTGDEPIETRISSEAPNNLFSRPELAKELILAVSEFESRVSTLLEKSKSLEPAEEHKKFARAWGEVLWQIGQSLLYPTYRRHKDLVPEELKNEIL